MKCTNLTVFAGLCAAIIGSGAPALSADKALIAVARKSLSSVQAQSFASDREYCGMIGRTHTGELIVSPARRGRASGCDARGFDDPRITPVASYHTHGAFHPEYDSEVPSVDDLDMDYHDKVFGFVATPGGRFWFIDYRSRTIKQICGMGCLPHDPKFKVGMAGDIPTTMTRRQMAQREGIGGPRHLRARAASADAN